MNDKAQFNLLSNPLFLIIISLVLIFLFIFVLSSDVGFTIKIPSSQVERGEDFGIYYEIKNDLLYGEISRINFTYRIKDVNGQIVEQDYRELGTLQTNSVVSDWIIIKTDDLSKGEYTIWGDIHYWRYGRLEAKYLSLKFSVT